MFVTKLFLIVRFSSSTKIIWPVRCLTGIFKIGVFIVSNLMVFDESSILNGLQLPIELARIFLLDLTPVTATT